MSSTSDQHDQEHMDRMFLYALRSLPANEMGAAEAQVSACADCRQEMQTLSPVVASFVSWPTDVLRPPSSLWGRLAERIAGEEGQKSMPPVPPPAPIQLPAAPEWEEAAPGIFCKLLATDRGKNRVSMLVRLAPGTEYPPHRHAGVEELHLLHGELTIDDKKFYPGDYIRALAGTVDHHVWSETGCTCVLLTSTKDAIL